MYSPEQREVSAQTTHTDGGFEYEHGYLRAAMHERPHEKKFNDSRDSEIQREQRERAATARAMRCVPVPLDTVVSERYVQSTDAQ